MGGAIRGRRSYLGPKESAPLKLSRLKVENYQRLQDFEIDIRSHLVLIGANDVGKSSLLRIIDLTLGASVAQLYASLSVDDLRDITEPMVVEITLTEFSPDDRALFPDEIDTVTNSLMIQLRIDVDEKETVSISRTAPQGGTGRQLSRDQLAALGWKFLSATAQTRDLRHDRRNPVNEMLGALELGDEKEAFASVAEIFQQKLNDSELLKNLREQLADQLSKALPQKVTTESLAFVSGAEADDDVLSDVRLQVTKAGTPHNLSEQSDGSRALYAIALYDLMSVGANVVGIDEPEIHLHPTSQRSLARLLRNSKSQKVIATHSSDIVGAFDISDIVVMRAGGEVVQSKRHFLSDDERTMARWWVRDKLEPLTSARIVTVEGLSDRILVERVAELTDRSLDRLGISVIETDGTAEIKSIAKLFGPDGFQIPVSRLIDNDATAKIADALGVAEAALGQHSVHVSMEDLEDEYVSALGATAVHRELKKCGQFSHNELANIQATGTNGRPTDSDVAKFCRTAKYKVRSALAVLPLLTKENASSITSIESLLDEIA
ncbi:ATP-dependent nuclease [Dermabacteraceae bacterium CCM 9519]